MTEDRGAYALTPAQLRWLGRFGVAAVWAYNGVYCKLMLGDLSHLEVISNLPFVNPAFALIPMAWFGLVETGLAVWVLSGLAPRRAAWVQTLLLLSMNSGGLLWARESICNPAQMLLQNFSFLVLIWFVAAADKEARHGCARA